jgi:methanogenic corrinoid protein MtbC1
MNSFAEQLKYIRREKGISQKVLAQAIGVGQTTIANYERGTRTPNVDLIGKIAAELGTTVDNLIGVNKEKVTQLNHQSSDIKPSFTSYSHQLVHDLLKGEMALVMELAEEFIKFNLKASDIYQYILTPSLIQIGDLWQAGEIDVHTEHYMTFAIESIMGYLMQSQMQSFYDHRRFMGLAIEKENHVVGIKMINHLMMLEGWQSYYVGNNLANNLVITALKKQSTDVLGISCTLKEHLPNIKTLIKTIRKEPLLKELKIIVGGQAITNNTELAKTLGADAIGIDLVQTINQIKELVKK